MEVRTHRQKAKNKDPQAEGKAWQTRKADVTGEEPREQVGREHHAARAHHVGPHAQNNNKK